jgi:hypothetical protein
MVTLGYNGKDWNFTSETHANVRINSLETHYVITDMNQGQTELQN